MSRWRPRCTAPRCSTRGTCRCSVCGRCWDTRRRWCRRCPVNSWYHAKSCVKRLGGQPEDYLPVHAFIDGSKQSFGDVRHRALYHHTEGIWVCERVFGPAITVRRERGSIQVPTREIAERHILEDLGWLPSFGDYIGGLPIKPWFSGARRREVPLSHVLGDSVVTVTE